MAVNVAASIAPAPSANRVSSEFDAKATSASSVKDGRAEHAAATSRRVAAVFT